MGNQSDDIHHYQASACLVAEVANAVRVIVQLALPDLYHALAHRVLQRRLLRVQHLYEMCRCAAGSVRRAIVPSPPNNQDLGAGPKDWVGDPEW
mgnify:CR=1 FL=1